LYRTTSSTSSRVLEEPHPLKDAAQLFREHEILLTGANGFVGKVLLGLLIDRFPDLKHLHIIVRARPGVSPRDRFFNDVLTSPCLKPVVEKAAPGFFEERISIHAGDVGDPMLGLSDEALATLKGRASVIINCAGLVEFFAPIDESFKSNVDGVENAIAVARHLGAKIVHISTCFVCGESHGLVEETEPILGYYPRRKGPADKSFDPCDEVQFIRGQIKEVYAGAARRGNTRHKEIAQRLADLGRQRASQWGWVNTYTYSKSLGEQLLVSEPDIDYAIVRPAIVEAALDFPFPGWVEGGRTAAPLIMMAMAGLRHWPLRPEFPLEVVPVDQVATSILTATVMLLNGTGPRVYQIGTADINPVSLGQLVEWMYEEHLRQKRRRNHRRRGLKIPAINLGVRIVSPPRAKARRMALTRRIAGLQRFVVGLRRMVQHTGLPGRRPLAQLGGKLRVLGLQLNIREQALELYQPFMLDNRFVFEAENIRTAHSMLSEEDRARLPWTPDRIEWKSYWVDHEIHGIQKWVEAEATKGWSFKV
jgi:long-chain acyl-CoA synthetase